MPLPDRGGHAVDARIWWADEVIPTRLEHDPVADRDPVPA
jgi:hypothetical protein